MTLLDFRNKCKIKVEDDLRKQLFSLYWSMNDYNKHTTYIISLIISTLKKVSKKKRSTPDKEKSREREYVIIQYQKRVKTNLLVRDVFQKYLGKCFHMVCMNKLNSPVNNCSPDKSDKFPLKIGDHPMIIN